MSNFWLILILWVITFFCGVVLCVCVYSLIRDNRALREIIEREREARGTD